MHAGVPPDLPYGTMGSGRLSLDILDAAIQDGPPEYDQVPVIRFPLNASPTHSSPPEPPLHPAHHSPARPPPLDHRQSATSPPDNPTQPTTHLPVSAPSSSSSCYHPE